MTQVLALNLDLKQRLQDLEVTAGRLSSNISKDARTGDEGGDIENRICEFIKNLARLTRRCKWRDRFEAIRIKFSVS